MSGIIAPSVLSFDLSNTGETVPRLARAGAGVIHFDVMDGRFVPPITFGAAYVKSLRGKTDALFEAHLMTETPERQFEAFAEAGVERLIFHAEATAHAHRLCGEIRRLGMSPGVAINPGTPVEAALALGGEADLILVMTVNPGWGGQSFIEASLDRIRAVRAARPDVLIEVDGGIDPRTAQLVREAGADLLVVGSYLLSRGALEERVEEMVRCAA